MHKKRHALGQNFLINHQIISQIVQVTLDQLAFFSIQNLVEIGPGKGAITLPLLEQLPSDIHFQAMEIDVELASFLKNKCPQLALLEKDARQFPADFFSSQPAGIVSNLPYSSGTHILLSLMKNPDIQFCVLMFQKEVAERIFAKAGSSKSASLSFWVQNVFDVESVVIVPPQSFRPAPQVFSQVLLLKKRALARIAISDLESWQCFLQKLFFAPRKMLRTKDLIIPSQLQTKRAFELTWEEIAILYNQFQENFSK
jgi:16S rRNA (adenine1518-N6/adenine1519-N6)-dimethyltransferase